MLKLLWRNKEESEDLQNNEDSVTSLAPSENTTFTDEYMALNDVDDDEGLYIEWRTVIFIRHGNSIWNESTDNSFKNAYSAAKAFSAFTSGVKEYAKLKWSSEYKHQDSIYVDTPLSPKGMKQAYNLSLFLKHHQQLGEQQKLLYLKQHQTISSPIKDAWRALQQYKLECNVNSSLCNDALSSLTKAMQSVEYLMANVDITSIDADIDTDIDIHMIPMDISYILDILIGKNKNICSKIVCSNLRRAISTCVLSLWDRLRFSDEKIYILSCLQEIGINVDTHTDTRQFQVPQVSHFEMISKNLNAKALNEFYSMRIETIYNYGSKCDFLMESQHDSQKRIELFAKWMFMNESKESISISKDKESINGGFKTVKSKTSKMAPAAIIAFGHSSWIKMFFNYYLPIKSQFIGKTTKLSNCGVVAFKFYYNKKKEKFGIAGNTITVIHKGFGAS